MIEHDDWTLSLRLMKRRSSSWCLFVKDCNTYFPHQESTGPMAPIRGAFPADKKLM